MTKLTSLKPFRKPLLTYAFARSALYQAEALMGPMIDVLVNRRRPRLPTDDMTIFKAARQSLLTLQEKDIERIVDGVYPLEVMKPGSPLKHMARMPAMFREGIAIARRRNDRRSHDFSKEARELLSDLPEYYQRNFHFQGDGYLSGKSADLYDHQVDVLFAGATDAMRRLVLAPMKKHFAGSDGEGLKLLEVGAGTGRTTEFLRLAFPRAKIVAVDLSAPYLKRAQARLMKYPRHDYLEADAARLPFIDGNFDAVVSVFMFHELPLETRRQVLDEGARVLKPAGFVGIVDSIQTGDDSVFDTALEQFPQEFHEPFYKNYVQNPLEDLLSRAGFEGVEKEIGFFAKVVSGCKRPE